MDEIEFAQAVAMALQKNTRDVVLHSMKTKGFSIDGKSTSKCTDKYIKKN